MLKILMRLIGNLGCSDTSSYKAQVEVGGILKTGNRGYSTFFPKSMSPQNVIDAINEAYISRVFKAGNEYYGYSSEGIKITMYINEKGK